MLDDRDAVQHAPAASRRGRRRAGARTGSRGRGPTTAYDVEPSASISAASVAAISRLGTARGVRSRLAVARQVRADDREARRRPAAAPPATTSCASAGARAAAARRGPEPPTRTRSPPPPDLANSANPLEEHPTGDVQRELLPHPRRRSSCGAAVADRDRRRVLAQRQPGDERRAQPVHVEHVADPLQRARLVGDLAVARPQHDPQRDVRRARRHRRLDVAQVVRRDRGERRARGRSDSRRRTAGFAPRPITTGSFTRRAKPTFSPSASVSTATTGTPHSRSSRQSRSPTCPSPTTTTWSRRGTARRPISPVRRESTSRLISPPVKHAADSSVSSIEATIVTLNHFGPSSTAGFGPTVASDFVEPYSASAAAWSSTIIDPIHSNEQHHARARSRRRRAAPRCGRRARRRPRPASAARRARVGRQRHLVAAPRPARRTRNRCAAPRPGPGRDTARPASAPRCRPPRSPRSPGSSRAPDAPSPGRRSSRRAARRRQMADEQRHPQRERVLARRPRRRRRSRPPAARPARTRRRRRRRQRTDAPPASSASHTSSARSPLAHQEHAHRGRTYYPGVERSPHATRPLTVATSACTTDSHPPETGSEERGLRMEIGRRLAQSERADGDGCHGGDRRDSSASANPMPPKAAAPCPARWPRRRRSRRPRCRRSSTASRRTCSRPPPPTGSAARSGSSRSFDTDGDGKLDRMHADYTLPKETVDRRPEGPGHLRGQPVLRGHRERLLATGTSTTSSAPRRRRARSRRSSTARNTSPTISTIYESTWLPRGFAVVHSESPGTGYSDGCPTSGGRNETLGATDVIDWLNGRRKALHDPHGHVEAPPVNWHNGHTAMMGTSYNGTIPIAAATTGVQGLDAIVPISAISRLVRLLPRQRHGPRAALRRRRHRQQLASSARTSTCSSTTSTRAATRSTRPAASSAAR